MHLVPIKSILQYFFGEGIVSALNDFYEEPSLPHLRAVVNFWFTFREASNSCWQVSSCPGCARKADFVAEIVSKMIL